MSVVQSTRTFLTVGFPGLGCFAQLFSAPVLQFWICSRFGFREFGLALDIVNPSEKLVPLLYQRRWELGVSQANEM